MTLPITRVVVHPDGAIVERSGRIEVKGGLALVPGLPLLLDESSVRVSARNGTLRQVRMSLDSAKVGDSSPPELWTAVRSAEARVRLCEARHAALGRERGMLVRVQPSEPDADPPRTPTPERIAGWLELDRALGAWEASIDERLRATEAELRDASQALAIARARLHEASSAAAWDRWIPRRVAELGLDLADGDDEISLSYRIEGACWVPSYALLADATLRRARFQMSALVAQATGEDWHGVQIGLSTAPVQRTVDLPELRALRLGKAQPPRPSPWRELPPGLDALFPPGIELPVPAPKPATGKKKRPAEPMDDGVTEQDLAMIADARQKALAPQSNAPVPVAAPQAMVARSAPKGGSAMGAVLTAAADALADMAPRGGGGGPAPAAPPPPARSMAAPEPAGPIEVEAVRLDYVHLRLGRFDAPNGVRGRLQPASVDALAAEAGCPPAAVDRLMSLIRGGRQRIEALRSSGIPTRHVLPGPIEGADYRYDAAGAVDVPSDGRWHAVSLFAEDNELSVSYRCVPRVDPRAFRTVTARLAVARPLPPGPVAVHVDGALVLVSPWRGSAKGGALEIGLGPEDGLRIARNVRYREETAGLIGNYRRTHTEIEVEIASGLARGAEVELLDRVPTSKDADVQIELLGASPPAEAFTGDEGAPILEGGKRQRISVPAGGRAVATLHYAVTIGSKQELVGGDRRG